MRRLTLIEDGSPEAAVLAEYLLAQSPHARRIVASGERDIPIVIKARRSAGISERLVTLAPSANKEADLDGSEAMRVVEACLADLDPFAKRVRGPARVLEQARTPEGASLAQLAALLAARPRTPQKPERRGRPKGTKRPFRGVGFDVAVALLLEPERRWSERELADAIGRSTYGVHRALVAFNDRGYLDRKRGATGLQAPLVLRDDLSAAWKERERNVTWFVVPTRDSVERAAAALKAHGHELLLAGPSATSMLGGAATFAYADGDTVSILRPLGFSVGAGRGQLAIWTPPEEGIFYGPAGSGVRKTNRVVTYIDLMALGGDRFEVVAEEVWDD